jgi:hypothetical protein
MRMRHTEKSKGSRRQGVQSHARAGHPLQAARGPAPLTRPSTLVPLDDGTEAAGARGEVDASHADGSPESHAGWRHHSRFIATSSRRKLARTDPTPSRSAPPQTLRARRRPPSSTTGSSTRGRSITSARATRQRPRRPAIVLGVLATASGVGRSASASSRAREQIRGMSGSAHGRIAAMSPYVAHETTEGGLQWESASASS